MSDALKLFRNSNENLLELVYSTGDGMEAEELGRAILGMKICLEEAAKIYGSKDFNIIVLPIEKGSVKTLFIFVRKNHWKMIIAADIIINLMNNSLDLIQQYGVNKSYYQPKEVIDNVQNLKILDLCRNRNFIKGSQEITHPLEESVQKLQIKYNGQSFEINCENRQKFFEEIEEDPILPELENGTEVQLFGEIIRINKESNDLGFRYKDRTLKGILFKNEEDITIYHDLIKENQVRLKGVVVRESMFKTPQIKIISIDKIENQNNNDRKTQKLLSI